VPLGVNESVKEGYPL